ncbi:uncharacterized protein LOC130621676 [Hydractinia symbiolongicarpus]|uniref:uncharacterized protein LOC130621676 n=1 Tax=Hydractinia symbiolongicarpus TaxID=13093 RepID=UPI00254A2473|nr:uncharacterized protein LOC130621676 [Hydractinia symbiolongicarpus]
MHIARRYSPPPPDPYPLPSLRLVILCVSVAVALSMVVVILLIDVRPPPLSDIFLTAAYFPLGQSLMLKTRRWTKNEKSCQNYGIPRFNSNFTDTLCGQAIWQSSADSEEGDRYVNKIETVYRFFVNDNVSAEYYKWNLLNGANLQLPLQHYSDETDIAPKAGQEYHAFKWDPLLYYVQKSVTDNDTSTKERKVCTKKECKNTFRHIVYIFRQNNAFARLIIFGFNQSRDARLGVDFAGRLAGTMVDLISQNQPSSLDAFIINFQTWVQFIVRTLPLKIINKAYLGIFMLGQGVMALFNIESWLTLIDLFTNQLQLLWQHLVDASIKDLYFLAVALLLLLIHRTQIFLMPYDEMHNVHKKCSSLLTSAVEKTRRQADSVKDDILLQS